MPAPPRPKTRRSARNHAKKRDLPPGTPVYVGESHDWTPRLSQLEYDEQELTETTPQHAKRRVGPTKTIRWLDLVGIHDAARVNSIGEAFGIHPLAIEDVLNPSTRPKFEAHEGCKFLVGRFIALSPSSPPGLPELEVEQVSLFAGEGWVLTFQQREGDPFEVVRTRLRKAAGRIRSMDADYLLHALLDAMVDRYFDVLTTLEDAAEELGRRALEDNSGEVVRDAQDLRAELSTVRRAAVPLREAIGRLLAEADDTVSPKTVPYFRDLLDHLVQVVEIAETTRDRVQSAIELALATANNRMNDVMRTLTVVAAIFIPLTFLAGIYGMNFEHMPELAWRGAYPALLGIMGTLVVGLLTLFRRRGWL